MGDLDLTLKYILRRNTSVLHSRLVRSLGHEGKQFELPTNLPVIAAIKETFADSLFRIVGDEIYILHVEHQATTDGDMAERMLYYLASIRYWRYKLPELRHLRVVQVLVYTGTDPWKNPPTGIKEEDIDYRYQFIRSDSIDPAPLLESGSIGDVIYAILCRGGTDVAVVRRVLERINDLPASEQREALQALITLCGYRGIDRLTMSEIRNMGIEFNFADTETGRELVKMTAARVERETAARVEQETAARVEQETARKTLIDSIVTVMQARFHEDLPADLAERLEGHTQEELRGILALVVTAASANEALSMSSGGSPPL